MIKLLLLVAIGTLVLVWLLKREFTRLEAAAADRRRAELEAEADRQRAIAQAARAKRWLEMTDEERWAENLRIFQIETYYALTVLRPADAFVITGITS